MLFRTHLVFGLLLGLFFSRFLKRDLFIFLFIVSFSAILADIDSYKSRIGKNIKLFSWLLNKIFGHRKIFHTVYFLIFIFFILMFFKLELVAYAFLIGYFSHLFIDTLTKQGIRPFYPFLKLKIRGFIKTGGKLEFLIFYFTLFLDFYYVIKAIF